MLFIVKGEGKEMGEQCGITLADAIGVSGKNFMQVLFPKVSNGWRS